MATWRRVERRDEGIPFLGVESEHRSVREALGGLVESRFQHEFADGLVCGDGRSLQSLLRSPRQTKIELFGAVCALSHVVPLESRILAFDGQCHDKTAPPRRRFALPSWS